MKVNVDLCVTFYFRSKCLMYFYIHLLFVNIRIKFINAFLVVSA